jgi:hypothetical protein
MKWWDLITNRLTFAYAIVAIQGEGYKMLNEGDELEFDIDNRERGPVAANARVVSTSVTEEQRQDRELRRVRSFLVNSFEIH